MNELKPCPFCGGKAELISHRPYASPSGITDYYVKCGTEGCTLCLGGLCFTSQEETVRAWNRRVKE